VTKQLTISCDAWLRPVLCHTILEWLRSRRLALIVIRAGRAVPDDSTVICTTLSDGAACVIRPTTPIATGLRAMCHRVEWHGSRMTWFASKLEDVSSGGGVTGRRMSRADYARLVGDTAQYGFDLLDGDIICSGDGDLDRLRQQLSGLEGVCALDPA
jgi:hypothetical protein